MKKTIRYTISGTLAVVAVLCMISSASAAIRFAEYHGDTTAYATANYTALGSSVFDGNLGYEITAVSGSNPQQGFFSDNSGLFENNPTRYFRFRPDLRSGGQNNIQLQGGNSVVPAAYTSSPDLLWSEPSYSQAAIADPNAYRLSLDGTWSNTTGPSTTSAPYPGFMANAGATGTDMVINWMLSTTSDGPNTPDIGGEIDLTVVTDTTYGERVYALGIVWEDLVNPGFLDQGDAIYIRYVLGADTFAEIDSAAKLNLAVGIPEPSTFALFGLGLAAFAFVRRRA